VRTIYFDLETGGLELTHPIIQLAAVAVDKNYNEIGSFERKIQFREADADPEALKINHYDRDAWGRFAVSKTSVVADFGEFLRSHADLPMTSKAGRPYNVALLAGYNAASFDGPRIQKLFKDQGAFMPAYPRVLDVLQLVLWHFHMLGEFHQSLKLEIACQLLGLKLEGAHDALADVRATVQVAKALAEQVPA